MQKLPFRFRAANERRYTFHQAGSCGVDDGGSVSTMRGRREGIAERDDARGHTPTSLSAR